MPKLKGAALQTQLERLPHWHFNPPRQAVERRFVFKDFNAAFGFMSRVALAAEQRNHHPEWSNVYNRVDLAFTTHEVGGLSLRDIDFALWVDELAAAIEAEPPAAPAPAPAPGGMPALYAEPGHLIRRAHQTAVAVFYGVQGRQVTPVQYAILRALLDHPGIDQVTLAGLVDLDTSTTADIAVRLEQKGWIVRERLPRRQRSLCLTEAGRGLLLAMLQKAQTMSAQLLQPLEAAEQAELMRLLRQLLRLPAQAAPAHRDNP